MFPKISNCKNYFKTLHIRPLLTNCAEGRKGKGEERTDNVEKGEVGAEHLDLAQVVGGKVGKVASGGRQLAAPPQLPHARRDAHVRLEHLASSDRVHLSRNRRS